ncbi:DUF2062 domain-containing protein [Neiella marina]|uniref:DUF2062 domain-containing protein n=1 Tax=Neiella holothuriorum TaxID=2870530 RepID=A0ABS7EDJ2_9GAMM|nr:DUF2062 domain-containing protein [Neiella holothuriorum]MBW8190335.1 DUF2062 domain-containing protein [Neiella holothuriorum]
MPRKTIKRIMPAPEALRANKKLGILGSLLHDPNLFHINRRSAAGAFAVGLFTAFLPIPSQMIVAAIIAGVVRVNLPLSVALVWVSNPITMAPMFYFAYKVGVWTTGATEYAFAFELSWEWLKSSAVHLGPAFLAGCVICGVVFGALGYCGIRLLWRWSVVKEWQKRQKRELNTPAAND